LVIITMFAGVSVYAEDGNASKDGVFGWFKTLVGIQKKVEKVEEKNERRQEMASSTRPLLPKVLEKKGNATSTKNASSTRMTPPLPALQAVIGTITNVNGNIFTLTSQVGSTTLTINASTAKIVKRGSDTATSTVLGSVSDLVSGQTVIILGERATSTQTMSAKQIIIGPLTAPENKEKKEIKKTIFPNRNQGANASGGFLGAIGNFFSNLFNR